MPIPDIMVWDEFAENSRGLMARPIMPNNVVALREHIATIQAEVYNRTDGGAPTIVPLTVNEVMLTAPSGKGTWNKDEIGYTFLWPADGTLWPDPAKVYQVVIRFTTVLALGSKQFVRVWRANTFDPATL